MEKLNLFMRLSKVDEATRTVSGIATAEVVDKSGEIMDYESTVPYYKAWSEEFRKTTTAAGQETSLGNIRAMHGKSAAGKIIDIEYDDVNKAIRVTAEIVDDQEWIKCKKGVYTGFSHGGSYIKRWTDPNNPAFKRYTAGPAELSIVDNPCVGIATFDYVKSDGSTEMRKFEVVAEAETDIEQVWRSKKDGSCFAKKTEVVNHNLDLAVAKVNDSVADVLANLKKAQEAVAEVQVEKAADTVTITDPVTATITATVEKTIEAEAAKTEDGKIATEADAGKREAAIKAASMEFQKGFCDVVTLIDVIQNLSWLQSDMTWNALWAGNESTLPADCKTVLAQLCDLLNAVVADATAAVTADKAAALTEAHVAALRKFTGNDELLKELTFAAPEPGELEKANQALAVITETLEAEKAAKAELENTISTLNDGLKEVTKGVEAIRAGNAAKEAEMEKRIQELEAQPMPPKGFVGTGITVEKGHEATETGSDYAPAEASTKNFRGLSPVKAVEKFAKKSSQ